MIIEKAVPARKVKEVILDTELAIVGGGLAGTCCAITAAREGMKVVLIQDRPVLGGNSSSEVRLWVLGATSHLGNNNRWAREGGVINEIMIENAYRNEESNPLIFDTILLEKVIEEENITLLLNASVYDLEKKEDGQIDSIRAFCSQNSTRYLVRSPLFCDASGDGIAAFMAGAAFRMGAESQEEFGEKFAPSTEYGELLGHSIYFYTKDTGRPVKFVPPSFALDDITRIPRYRKFSAKDQGCSLWWIEYGGRMDTVHDTEAIKWELWKVVYGVWNHIKNSGEFPEAKNMTLEWVGTIPGKRESRRFEGDYMLKQQDIIEQTHFDDVVAFGGWSIDLHPADGVFSEKPGCNQWHSKGIFGIPYRCYYSHNVSNLFLAGRIISSTHVAFGSTRVMGTGAHGGQAVGIAASLCKKYSISPREVGQQYVDEIQLNLLKSGQHLPGICLNDNDDLVQHAIDITATSALVLQEIPAADIWRTIKHSAAQMLPVSAGEMPTVTLYVNALEATTLEVQLRRSSKVFNHTPDIVLETKNIALKAGKQEVFLDFDSSFSEECYAFVCFMKNEQVELEYSDKRITGLLSVFNSTNPAVSNYGKQEPTEDIGVESFEFWCPQRRPEGYNIGMKISPGLQAFSPFNIRNGLQRPVAATNAWTADYADRSPVLTISWERPVTINRVELSFDCDYDHPMENVLMRQPDAVQPFCATDVVVYDSDDREIGRIEDNHQARRTIVLAQPVTTSHLKLKLENSNDKAPVSLFEVRCY
mgnify:CR=1 FL=1